VTVRGSRIKPERNGYTILDADILTAADYMYEKERLADTFRRW